MSQSTSHVQIMVPVRRFPPLQWTAITWSSFSDNHFRTLMQKSIMSLWFNKVIVVIFVCFTCWNVDTENRLYIIFNSLPYGRHIMIIDKNSLYSAMKNGSIIISFTCKKTIKMKYLVNPLPDLMLKIVSITVLSKLPKQSQIIKKIITMTYCIDQK